MGNILLGIFYHIYNSQAHSLMAKKLFLTHCIKSNYHNIAYNQITIIL